MDITHQGIKKPIEQAFAESHAAAMTKGHPFTIEYMESADSGDQEWQIDSLAVALIATLLPVLSGTVAKDVAIDWYTTAHGIIISMPTTDCRLYRGQLLALASDQRIRWAEVDKQLNLTIGLMFLKQYQALS
jgi:hypothetical protein